jgi:heat shock protein HtpX
VAVVLALMMTSVSYFAGDSIVLAASRRAGHEADAPQLMNVVREMSIAANIPPPKVYLIDDTAPNAFATGRDPKHASIAVTTGLLEKLDREELQGVIGHELAHVRNLDIRFALLVGVLVGSIVLLADFFLRFTFWGGAGGGRAVGRRAAAAAAGWRSSSSWSPSCWPSSRRSRALVQMAVSRQREYLADASSVELTRNPYGLERALAQDRTARCSRWPTAPPSTCTSSTRSRSSRRASEPDVDPPTDRRAGQPAARAHRRARRSWTFVP